MNWYKKSWEDEEDTIDDPDQPPPQIRDLPVDESGNSSLGEKAYKKWGVWMYPFSMVKRDDKEGWYIDWSETQGSISNIDLVQVGDKIADHAVNMTPYWVVKFIDSNKSFIYVDPIEPNPFLTGVGAGGATITQHDIDIHTGVYEEKRVNKILKDISEGTVSDIHNVTYLLKGTVPLQMGPNGGQGGWYAPGDRYNARGAREGMSSQEMMVFDAKTLKRMGFAVPKMALDGKMDVGAWVDFVNNNGSEMKQEYASEGEDYSNPQVTAQYVMNHKQPSVKLRNLNALENLHNPHPNYEQMWSKYRLNQDDEGFSPKWDKQIELWKSGKNLNPQISPLLKKTLLSISGMTHPSQDKLNFDVYWYLKENAINIAERYKWADVLAQFENSYDSTNREYVVRAYCNMNMIDKAIPIIKREKDPKVKQTMSYWLSQAEQKSSGKYKSMNWYKKSQWVKKPNQWSWEMFLKGISLGIFGSIALEFLAVSQWDKIKSVYEKNKNIFMQNPASAVEVSKQDFEDLSITQQEQGENVSVNPGIVNPNKKNKPDIRKETVDQTIARHEGKRYTVYKDTKKIPTIGIGFNLLRNDAKTKIESLGLTYESVLKGQQSLTNDQINTLYKQDLSKARHDARGFISNFDKQPASIQNVLVNMAFNMGAETLSEFKNFKLDIENKNYQSAAQRMERSKWYKQVGDRSKELTKLVRDTVKSFLTGNWYKQSNPDKIKEFEEHWKEILGLGEYAPDVPQPKKKKKSRDFQHSMDINEDQEDDGW